MAVTTAKSEDATAIRPFTIETPGDVCSAIYRWRFDATADH
jgi:hypothetical protein